MYRIFYLVMVVLTASIVGQVSAAVSLDELDGILGRLGGYDYGKESRSVNDLDSWMRGRSKAEIADGQVEQRLAGFLQGQASPAAKRYVCEQLSLIGTSVSVGVLSEMLVDPATVECARYALERIPGEEANEALRAGLLKTDGAAQIGIINSLGVRRDTGSIGVLAELLDSYDWDAAMTAATAVALGKIGGGYTLKVLRSAMDSVEESNRQAVFQACIACADGCRAEEEQGLRFEVYSDIFEWASEGQLRAAALAGMADVQGDKAYGTVMSALDDEDRVVRGGAVSVVREIGDAVIVQLAARKLDRLPVDTRVQLLSVLADCGGAGEKPAVVKACDDTDESVQAAGLGAMGKLGGAGDVMFLVCAAVTHEGAVQAAARTNLDRLRGGEVDSTIVSAIADAKAAEKVELIRSCAAREIKTAVPEVLECARDSDRNVRIESLKSLRTICDEIHLPTLIDLLLAAEGGSEQREARKTIVAVARTIPSPERRADAVVAELETLTDSKGRCLLLRILGELGSRGGLETLYASVKAGDGDVRDASIRALSDWPTAEPAGVLMEIVEQAGSTEKNKALALRGYIRLAGLVNGDADKSLAMYRKAMKHATRMEEKRQVVAGLSNLKSAVALAMVEGLLGDESLKAETGASLVALADELDERHPLEVKRALESLLKANDDSAIQAKAKSLLDFQYITDWELAGPYTQAGKSGVELMDEVFGPETAGSADGVWKPLKVQIDPSRFWQVNLGEAVGQEACVVYLRTLLKAGQDQRTYLYFGCEGDYKVFLNGDLYEQAVDRTPCFPGEHAIRLEARQGWNELMIKIAHASGEWCVCGRIRDKEGHVEPEITVGRRGK